MSTPADDVSPECEKQPEAAIQKMSATFFVAKRIEVQGKSMEIMELQMFVAVVEEGNARRSGKKVFRGQPAVTLAIRRLEQEHGLPLLDKRQRGKYLLTPAGAMLYSYTLRLIRTYNQALTDIQQVRQLPGTYEAHKRRRRPHDTVNTVRDGSERDS